MSRVVTNNRAPNFRSKEGNLFLVRCFNCDHKNGRENWGPAVASGRCAWCGWEETFSNTAVTQAPENSAKNTKMPEGAGEEN